MYPVTVFLMDASGEVKSSLNLMFDALPRIAEQICVHNDWHPFKLQGEVTKVTHICSASKSEMDKLTSIDFLGDRNWFYHVSIREVEWL